MIIKPRKRFSQHFLCDEFIIAKIIALLNPKPNEHLIEIGGGQGALTFPVLKETKNLTVIEVDRDLVKFLTTHKPPDHQLTIYEQDALQCDFATLKQDARKLRIFGNLPYNITTPLIFHLLSFSAIIADMLFMVQKEVAMRLAAHPNNKDYGRLSIMVQYYCEVQTLLEIPPYAFSPRPKVFSSMIRLIPYKEPPYLAKDPALFANIVKLAFCERRKTLRNSLKNLITDEMWHHLPIDSHLRPENLAVRDFVTMSNALSLMR